MSHSFHETQTHTTKGLRSPANSDNLHYEKFPDGTVKCIEDEIPFDVPDGWAWSRFSSAFIINPRNNLPDDAEVSFIPMPLIQEGYANKHTDEEKLWNSVKSGFTHFANNDVGIAKITPCFENKKSVVFKELKNGYGAGTTELHIILCTTLLCFMLNILIKFLGCHIIDFC